MKTDSRTEIDSCIAVQKPAGWENILSGRLVSCDEYQRNYAGTVNVELVYAPLYRAMPTSFSHDELDLLRQWFNAMEDTNPKYILEMDRELFRKIKAATGRVKS
ncbi:hypothetical protein [Serratia fonticola]|uniref:hypothetical protein n=1 Tax=Serratia fonticola TaxID=47917 RepID=UPI001644D3DE|nr:hypothetical protein [Serratia fonticola]MBC3228334.1 hypothetical protein [Serratia fonticola]